LGIPTYSPPGAASWGPDRIDLFWFDPNDRSLWHAANVNGNWAVLEDLGGSWNGAPAVTSTQSGYLDIYLLGDDKNVYRKTWRNEWSGWIQMTSSANFRASPSASSATAGNIDIAICTLSERLIVISTYDDGNTWSLTDVASCISSYSPSILSSLGLMNVFMTGNDHSLNQKSCWLGVWQNYPEWTNLGDWTDMTPTIVKEGPQVHFFTTAEAYVIQLDFPEPVLLNAESERMKQSSSHTKNIMHSNETMIIGVSIGSIIFLLVVIIAVVYQIKKKSSFSPAIENLQEPLTVDLPVEIEIPQKEL